ncbi:MAG: thermonuclease family protein [Methylococcaceae bacterium]|nr:thermonuclease family protein [Methylococcaceae bacterium]MDD1642823.1 thermonuclease family protein [Methylococcaceae bacterium]OYV18772.1 MAG: nuclease [Methylococcaceae bacterium NSM2-1]
MQSNLPLNYQISICTGRLKQGLLILLLCLPAWVDAEIYQWLDVKGSEHFSDRFHPDAKTVNIKPGYDYYRVKTVYDGDTVVLEDGRKIRLLGINTPEVQHKDKRADAGGEDAKVWLINKLQHARIRLEFDSERTDKYGRILAHLFNEQKEHINLSLVKAGLATISIYPPNLLYVNELLAAENKAEQDSLGIWQRPEYAVIPVSNLKETGHPGWTRLVGKVASIRNTRKSVYLVFSDQFEARIERKWLSLFPAVNDYLGKTVEVRGWLNNSRKHFSLLIRHPGAIRLRENR